VSALVNANLSASLQNIEYDQIADAVAAATGPAGRVLDWGAGYGQMMRRLTDRGLNAQGFEYDERVDGAEEGTFELYPELSVTRSNEPVKLPYDDQSFDTVLCCGVLEHVAEPLDSLHELYRVLKPGGALLIYKLPNYLSALEFVARVGGLDYHGMRPHDTLWGVRSTDVALRMARFDVDWVRRANYLPLTVDHPALNKRSQALWKLNVGLGKVPGIRLLATNVDALAHRPANS
jgi:SAM-dependent methyltransferase